MLNIETLENHYSQGLPLHLFPHHVESVEASERRSDLLHHLGLVGEELLQNSRSGKHLLDFLGSSQVSADIWTFHSQRALHHETGFPGLHHA